MTDDVPALLDRVAEDPNDQGAWSELWSELCHQGSVTWESFASLPALAALARRHSATARIEALVLAGAIVGSTDWPRDAVDPHVAFEAEISELRELTEDSLRSPGLVDDTTSYVYLLASLLAFEDVAVWGDQLEGLNDEEYEVPCPACGAENFVAFGRYGCFSTLDPMYMTNTDTKRLPLMPAEPADLDGLAVRLYDRAVADRQLVVATKLTYVFGTASCADCEALFRVDEAVVARWSA